MVAGSKILVLDFGGQYAHLLARRVREIGVYSQILLPDVSTDKLKEASGIILSGGPSSVYEKDAPKFNPDIFKLDIPILGLCYGQQLIGHELKGIVQPGKIKEYGSANLSQTGGRLFQGLPKNFTVWMSHGDAISKLPKGFVATASTTDCKFAAIENVEKKIYGLQFHPEVSHTQNGIKILSNFVLDICRCKKDWDMKSYLKLIINEVKKEVNNKKVFLLLSGGVDSTVALALLAKAVPKGHLFALHVDTGFMRKGESALVKEEIEKLELEDIHVLEASEKFLNAVKNTTEPEEKRHIIGQLFVDLALEEMKKLGFSEKDWLLGQGTIYPDTIETGATKHSNKIKTHHNRAPIIMKMIEDGKVIEPLKQLYKDEVRELGKFLNLPEKLVNRRPFPGPGLAIRILCSSKEESVNKKSEKEIIDLAKKSGYIATLLPVKAVGVQGDNRTYRNTVLLEGDFDYAKLEALSTSITNSSKEVNRVIYLISPQKCESAKPIVAYLTKERIKKLQQADSVAMQEADSEKFNEDIWQFPVVLLPLNFNSIGEVVVLRPITSKEAMTAKFYPLDEKIAKQISEKILKIKGIGAVTIDVTHKPPATIEWE